jgi:WD40 repeat protein
MTLLPAAGSEVQVWDVSGPTKVAILAAPMAGDTHWRTGPVCGFNHQGTVVWLKLPSGDVIRWDAATWEELPRLKSAGGPHPEAVYSLADGKSILTTCRNGWVRVWDAATGNEHSVPGRYWNAVIALAPDGKLAAIGDKTGRIDLLDVATGKRLRSLREKGFPVQRLFFSPDGQRLSVGETPPEARSIGQYWRTGLLRLSDGAEIWPRRKQEDPEVSSLVPLGFSSNDDLVLADSKFTRVWNTSSGKELRRFSSLSLQAVPSFNGKCLVTEDHGEIVLIDLATGRETKRILVDPVEKARKSVIGASRFSWSADGRTLAATLLEDRVSILDPVLGKELRRFQLYTGDVPEQLRSLWANRDYSVWCLALSPDGKRLASSALNGWYVAVWNTETGQEVVRLDHDFQIDSLAFTPDGKSVVTFGSTGLGYRWEIDSIIAARKK